MDTKKDGPEPTHAMTVYNYHQWLQYERDVVLSGYERGATTTDVDGLVIEANGETYEVWYENGLRIQKRE